MVNLYNAEGYISPTEHEAFTCLEKEEKAARKAAAFRPIVYICSPYSGDTERNIENAKKYSRFAVDRHCLPIAPAMPKTRSIRTRRLSPQRQTSRKHLHSTMYAPSTRTTLAVMQIFSFQMSCLWTAITTTPTIPTSGSHPKS